MKEKLLEHIRKPNDKLIAVDMDGVLCYGEFWGEKDVEPNTEIIQFVNGLYMKGAHIIIYTARNPKWFIQTQTWLDRHNVMYHGIAMMKKIGADVYIDDKALNLEDVINDLI